MGCSSVFQHKLILMFEIDVGVEMARSAASSPSSQVTLRNDKPLPTLRSKPLDGVSHDAESQGQRQDTAPEGAEMSSIEQIAAPVTSSLSSCSDGNKVHNVFGASTRTGPRQQAYPCEPCESRELKCDGVRPMCDNCEMDGRRCYYEYEM